MQNFLNFISRLKPCGNNTVATKPMAAQDKPKDLTNSSANVAKPLGKN